MFSISLDLDKNVNNTFFEELKDKALSDIIREEISDKYSKKKILFTNRDIYNQLKNERVLKNLFNENYLSYFKNYYNFFVKIEKLFYY